MSCSSSAIAVTGPHSWITSNCIAYGPEVSNMWLAITFYMACLLIFIQGLACRPVQSPKCFFFNNFPEDSERFAKHSW